MVCFSPSSKMYSLFSFVCFFHPPALLLSPQDPISPISFSFSPFLLSTFSVFLLSRTFSIVKGKVLGDCGRVSRSCLNVCLCVFQCFFLWDVFFRESSCQNDFYSCIFERGTVLPFRDRLEPDIKAALGKFLSIYPRLSTNPLRG